MTQRLRDYLRFAAWQSGISYLVLWAMTWWALDYGSSVFGGSAGCRVEQVRILFYWACAPDSVLFVLAAAANSAFTLTIWAPVFVVLASVNAALLPVAAMAVFTHVIGLPAAIFVVARAMLKLSAWLRRLDGRAQIGLVSQPTSQASRTDAPWSTGRPSKLPTGSDR